VSTSASGSPTLTLSPSFLSQRVSCPSSIVGESFGMTTCVAIKQSSVFSFQFSALSLQFVFTENRKLKTENCQSK
jgi:hypothetical protein